MEGLQGSILLMLIWGDAFVPRGLVKARSHWEDSRLIFFWVDVIVFFFFGLFFSGCESWVHFFLLWEGRDAGFFLDFFFGIVEILFGIFMLVCTLFFISRVLFFCSIIGWEYFKKNWDVQLRSLWDAENGNEAIRTLCPDLIHGIFTKC